MSAPTPYDRRSQLLRITLGCEALASVNISHLLIDASAAVRTLAARFLDDPQMNEPVFDHLIVDESVRQFRATAPTPRQWEGALV